MCWEIGFMWFQTTAITLLFSLLSVLYLVPTRDRKKRDSDAHGIWLSAVFVGLTDCEKESIQYDIGNYCEGTLWRKSWRNCFVICRYFRNFETVVGCYNFALFLVSSYAVVLDIFWWCFYWIGWLPTGVYPNWIWNSASGLYSVYVLPLPICVCCEI